MKRFLAVADPMGGPQRIIPRAAQLAADMDAELVVAGFVFEHLGTLPLHKRESEHARVRQAVVERRHAELEAQARAAAAKHKIGVRVEVHWEDRIAEWLIGHVAATPYDLVIKTGHRSETLAYTPTDWQLLRGCRTPVLLVGEKHWRKSRHVLAAVDLGTRVRAKSALNYRVVEHAAALAGAIGAELRIGYALPFSQVLRDLDLLDERELKREALRRAEDFRRSLARSGIDVETVQVVVGAPEKALVNLAAKLGAAVVVLGCVGRKRLAGRVIGNTAEQLLRLLKTDVLAIPP
jgi:universal stress protein E